MSLVYPPKNAFQRISHGTSQGRFSPRWNSWVGKTLLWEKHLDALMPKRWRKILGLKCPTWNESRREVGFLKTFGRVRCLLNINSMCIYIYNIYTWKRSLIIWWAWYLLIRIHLKSESADRFSRRSSFTESSTSFKVAMWECQYLQILTRWWFQICFTVHPYLGKMSDLTSIFFRWVVQPPTSWTLQMDL